MADKNKMDKAKKMASKGLSEGAKRPRSSRGLTRMSINEGNRRRGQARNKYGDKGIAGNKMIKQIEDEVIDQAVIDTMLVSDYGEDAAKARTFMTPKKKTENLSGGGKVRGVGVAQRGFGKAPYSDKLI